MSIAPVSAGCAAVRQGEGHVDDHALLAIDQAPSAALHQNGADADAVAVGDDLRVTQEG